MKTLTKNKKLAISTLVVMLITILSVSIGLIATAIESNRKVVADTENGQLLSGKVYDMPKQLTLTDMADGEGVNLKVILKPSFVENAKINFSLKWKDAAVEDDINTYLTLTTVSDTQCNIKIAQRFNNQIELVATAEVDSSVTKSCAVDCYSYLESMNMTYEINHVDLITKTGKITANSTDNIFGIGSSTVSQGAMIGVENLNMDYFINTSVIMKGDYIFGFGTKPYFDNLTANLIVKSGTNMSSNPDEYITDIDFSQSIDISAKTGTFEFVSKEFGLNYFYSAGHFARWYPQAYEKWKDSINAIPEYQSGREFYMNNANRFIDDLTFNFSLDIKQTSSGIFYHPITLILTKTPNYLYDISFNDSITLS